MATNPNAKDAIDAQLAQYGLSGLTDALWTNYTNGLVDMGNLEAAVYALRNEKVYKERFKANESRTNPNRPGRCGARAKIHAACQAWASRNGRAVGTGKGREPQHLARPPKRA